MNDNLPPLPPCAPEFKPRWPTDPGGYNEEQMQAYARAAIERQSVPAESLTPVIQWLEAGCNPKHAATELRLLAAAATKPQPVQEPVAHFGSAYVNENGVHITTVLGPVAIPQDAKLYTSPQAQPQPVQEQCPECDGTGTVAGSQAHFHCPICTSPQEAQPLSDADVQQISRALHRHGLTLVRTVQGFGVMKLGEITAYAATKGTT